jgi:hypothetical protein
MTQATKIIYPMSKIILFTTKILILALLLPINLIGIASYNPILQQWDDTITDTSQEIVYQYNYTETGTSDAYGYFEMIIGSDNPALGAGQVLVITSIKDQWDLSSSFGLLESSTSRTINPINASWINGSSLHIRFGPQMPANYCTNAIATGGCDIAQATLGNNIKSINNGTGNGLITITARIDSRWIPNPTPGQVYTLKSTQGGQIMHPLGYNINPKSWQIKIDLANITATTLKLYLNLAGAYNPSTKQMNTGLYNKNVLPSSSPYEMTANVQNLNIPNTAVDWIFLQLLQGGQAKYSKSLILLANGIAIDPASPNQSINLSSLPAGNYQAIIMHRNHLSISTNQDITINPNTIINLDLRANINVKGSNQAMLGDNQFGLKSGNVNDDLYINSSDRVLVRNQKDTANLYSDYDINLDGQISSQDRSLARLNKESFAQL